MKFVLVLIATLFLAGFIFRKDLLNVYAGSSGGAEKTKHAKKNKDQQPSQVDVTINNRWDLPEILVEVSGIAYINENEFACVQDEAGTIYFFNTSTGKIEKEIVVTGPGDFEGLAINGDMAYIVRADGVLFETNMNSGKTTEYKTYLTVDNNIEGLCFDKKNNRLLLAGKDIDNAYPGYKGIYAFDLATKTLAKLPAFKIALDDEILRNKTGKKSKDIMPSSIGIHPITGDFYITDGTTSQLLVMNAKGDLVRLYELGKAFTQPEGITFSPSGSMFISNEGKKKSGNIMEVKLD